MERKSKKNSRIKGKNKGTRSRTALLYRQIRKIPGRYEVGDFAYSGCTGRGLTCLVDEAAGEGGKFVDAPIAEERPPAAHILAALHVDVDKVDAFALGVGTE